MQSKEDKELEEAKKTGILLGVGNLLLWPVYYADSRWGVVASVAASAAALYGLHELGKSRRSDNPLNQANNFFAQQTGASSNSIDNAFKNLVHGGAAVYDEITHPSTSPKK